MIRHVSIAIVLVGTLCACSVSIDPSTVQARSGAPASAIVESVQIAKNPSNPTTFLVVEPVRVAERGSELKTSVEVEQKAAGQKNSSTDIKVVSSTYRNYLLNRQRQISYQLTTALSGVGDFSVVDYDKYQENKLSSDQLGGGLGPYYVRAVITECSSGVVSSSRKKQLPLIYRKRDKVVEGVVGLDVSVIDAINGKVITSVPVQSSYIDASKSAKGGFIATISESDVQMKSTIDQALRVALNTAASKLHARLYQE